MFYKFDQIPFAKDKHEIKKKLDTKSNLPDKCEEVLLMAEARKKFHTTMEQMQKGSAPTFTEAESEELLKYLDSCSDFASSISSATTSKLEFEYATFASPDRSSFTVKGSKTSSKILENQTRKSPREIQRRKGVLSTTGNQENGIIEIIMSRYCFLLASQKAIENEMKKIRAASLVKEGNHEEYMYFPKGKGGSLFEKGFTLV